MSDGSVQHRYVSHSPVIIYQIGQTVLVAAGQANITGKQIFLRHIPMNTGIKSYTFIYMIVP